LVKRNAKRLGYFVQSIYSYCDHMDRLKVNVTEQVNHFLHTSILNTLDL